MFSVIKRIIAKGFFSGISFGIGLVVILGVYFLVQAVAPGVVKNPTFGPTDDDVDVIVSGQTVFFDELSAPLVFSSVSCSDGTNGVWKPIDVSPHVPAGTKAVFITGVCGENHMYVRPNGSTIGGENKTWVCSAGNDSSMTQATKVVTLKDNKFDTYNSGTDCDTRGASIFLMGYVK